jgi:hypothetical protein
MLHDSFMSRPNTIVCPGWKMDLAIQLIFTPMTLRLMERRRGPGRLIRAWIGRSGCRTGQSAKVAGTNLRTHRSHVLTLGAGRA